MYRYDEYDQSIVDARVEDFATRWSAACRVR